MMIRKHLKPPNENDKQILEELTKVDIFQFLLS